MRQFSKEEQKEIDMVADAYFTFFQKFRVDWEGEKINDKEE